MSLTACCKTVNFELKLIAYMQALNLFTNIEAPKFFRSKTQIVLVANASCQCQQKQVFIQVNGNTPAQT